MNLQERGVGALRDHMKEVIGGLRNMLSDFSAYNATQVEKVSYPDLTQDEVDEDDVSAYGQAVYNFFNRLSNEEIKIQKNNRNWWSAEALLAGFAYLISLEFVSQNTKKRSLDHQSKFSQDQASAAQAAADRKKAREDSEQKTTEAQENH